MRAAEAFAGTLSAIEPAVLLGASNAAQQLNDAITAAAVAPFALIEGEPGLHLDQVASAVHGRSRRTGPCLQLTPAAGEDPGVIGAAFASADGGTLVVADLQRFSAAGQRRLIQQVRGADRGASPAVIATCSVGDDGRARLVRRDLIRRLAHARVSVLPLRERREDIPTMVTALLTVACDEAGVNRRTISAAAMSLLAALPWRGNLVEMREAAIRLARMSRTGEIDVGDVIAHVEFDAVIASSRPVRTLRAARRQFERDYICEVLRLQGGRVGDAARVLGIQRTNLYRKARQLGISVTRPEQA